MDEVHAKYPRLKCCAARKPVLLKYKIKNSSGTHYSENGQYREEKLGTTEVGLIVESCCYDNPDQSLYLKRLNSHGEKTHHLLKTVCNAGNVTRDRGSVFFGPPVIAVGSRLERMFGTFYFYF